MLILPAVYPHVSQVQSMFITYLTERATTLRLGLRQHRCECLYRL